jgi:DNA-nicking Smr family endonuclease
MASRRSRRRFHDPDHEDLEDDGPDESPWAHEVDLHGCTVEGAERRLLGELTRCRAARRSPVLVITGRGYGSTGGTGVLGPAVRRWLEGPRGRELGVARVREERSRGALVVEIERG